MTMCMSFNIKILHNRITIIEGGVLNIKQNKNYLNKHTYRTEEKFHIILCKLIAAIFNIINLTILYTGFNFIIHQNLHLLCNV